MLEKIPQDILPPSQKARGKKPRKDNNQKQKDPWKQLHPFHLYVFFLTEKKEETPKKRKDQSNRSLGQGSKGHTDIKTKDEKVPDCLAVTDSFFPALLMPEKETNKRSGRKKGECHVNVGAGGEIDEMKACGQDESGEEPRSGRIKPFPQKESEKDGECPKEGGGKPHGKGGESFPQVGRESDQPKEKGRLVAVDAPVEMHDDPIASVQHLPGNLCITGLIRIP